MYEASHAGPGKSWISAREPQKASEQQMAIDPVVTMSGSKVLFWSSHSFKCLRDKILNYTVAGRMRLHLQQCNRQTPPDQGRLAPLGSQCGPVPPDSSPVWLPTHDVSWLLCGQMELKEHPTKQLAWILRDGQHCNRWASRILPEGQKPQRVTSDTNCTILFCPLKKSCLYFMCMCACVCWGHDLSLTPGTCIVEEEN